MTLELKKKLTEELRLLEGDNDQGTKKSAYANIVKLVNEITLKDKNFSFNEKVLEKYSAFRPDDVPAMLKKVKWETGKVNESLINSYSSYVATARHIVDNRFPNEDSDGNVYGQIVNATTANLIQIDLINAIQDLNIRD